MENQDYTANILVAASPTTVVNHIKEVSKWWSKDFEGNSENLNDEFVICHPDQHYSKQKLIEVIPDKKIVWLVTESNLYWLKKNKHEWTDTKMIFKIFPKGDMTQLYFTHEGINPGKECFSMCEQGWNMVIKDRLFNFITINQEI